MRASANQEVEVRWISQFTPLHIGSEAHEEIRVVDRTLRLVDWLENEEVYVRDTELFGTGPTRALVLRQPRVSDNVLLLGEEGAVLLRLDIPIPERIAELPRASNKTGGMCFISILVQGEMTLLHWELGVLGLDQTLALRWRQDLEWNHRIVHLDASEIWFDLMYEAANSPQRIGDAPWGFSVRTGRQLFDQTPPSPRVPPNPLKETP